MKIEIATKQDIPSIAECWVGLRMHQRERQGGQRPSLRGMMRQVERNMEKPHCRYFVAKESDNVIAAAFVRLRSGGRSAHLARAYTVPSHRRKGVMRRLEQAIIEFLRKRRITTLDLTVVPYNMEGMATWPALGYKPTKIVMTKQVDC